MRDLVRFLAGLTVDLLRSRTALVAENGLLRQQLPPGDQLHGVITNVKDSTVIVRVADNVKLELEKSHIDKITRPDSGPDPEKAVTAKVS